MATLNLLAFFLAFLVYSVSSFNQQKIPNLLSVSNSLHFVPLAEQLLSATMFLLILLLVKLPGLVDADPLYTFCPNSTANYTTNGTFANNLRVVLQRLPFSTSSSLGFNNTSFGEDPNIVYGQALCRGDVNPTVCQTCVQNAGQEILKQCKNKDALIWFEFCQVRYSYHNFFSLSEYSGKYVDSESEKKNMSDPVRFGQNLADLMKNLSSKATSDPYKRMFATGEVKISWNQTIYGLVQCTRDTTESDCNSCLGSALEELGACCSSKQGGLILGKSCSARFELRPFYNASGYSEMCTTRKAAKLKTWMIVLAATLPVIVLAICIGSFIVCLRGKRGNMKDEVKSHHSLLHELVSPNVITMTRQDELVNSEELPFVDLTTLIVATDNFSDKNKLGQGGFGMVYKGLLPDGKEIAVKRLSTKSWQGLEEFKNEIKLIAKLQHRNLVRVLGCAIEGDEKMLIYEFMPNRSLDTLIFDSERRAELDWKTCYNIIHGIARGLLYLHENSRLTIIHRDLKPSNVLLDHEMVAKISDFGMARIFDKDQNTANTRRVVGTYGYMAPEYAMGGLFSTKSDIFSFGVTLLEIISGKKNSGFYLTGHSETLLAYAWRLWNEGKEMELVDTLLVENGTIAEVVRCMHIGLLCVQEDPADRPPMSSVVLLLTSKSVALLPQPKKPAFSPRKGVSLDKSTTTNASVSFNTVSSILPR